MALLLMSTSLMLFICRMYIDSYESQTTETEESDLFVADEGNTQIQNNIKIARNNRKFICTYNMFKNNRQTSIN